jgi:hypothetical protein
LMEKGVYPIFDRIRQLRGFMERDRIFFFRDC